MINRKKAKNLSLVARASISTRRRPNLAARRTPAQISSLPSSTLPTTHQLQLQSPPSLRNGGQVLVRRQRERHEGHPGAHAPPWGRGGGARPARVVREQVREGHRGQRRLRGRTRDGGGGGAGLGGDQCGGRDRGGAGRVVLVPGGRDGAGAGVRGGVREGEGGRRGNHLQAAAHVGGPGAGLHPVRALDARSAAMSRDSECWHKYCASYVHVFMSSTRRSVSGPLSPWVAVQSLVHSLFPQFFVISDLFL
ncbi:hypothetical protein KC19_3G056400, partial [Ceratodon purpureus]